MNALKSLCRLPDSNGQSPRVTGFLQRARLRKGKRCRAMLVPGGWHVEEGQEGAARLMKLPVPATALVAPNDMAAIGVITKLKELDRRVPEDVTIVGPDNIAIADGTIRR